MSDRDTPRRFSDERLSALEQKILDHDAWERQNAEKMEIRVKSLEDFFRKVDPAVSVLGWASVMVFGVIVYGVGTKIWHFLETKLW